MPVGYGRAARGASRRPYGDLDPATYQGTQVGELWINSEADRAFLERVAILVSAHVLIG